MPLIPGTRLGAYEIVAPLGVGGMGEVYRARDPRLGREVAIKVLPTESLHDDTARARLVREARLSATLNHPNICTVHEVGEADGHIFLAMELIEGLPLSRKIAERGAGLPIESVVQYGAQIAAALAHAHERHVIHRDLKSSNVVVTPDGRVKVLDFGVARRAWEGPEETAAAHTMTLTEAGAIVGTPDYLAPEVLCGGKADERSDVWALGVLMNEMASGTLPFKGATSFELASAIMHAIPAALPDRVPAGLRAVITRCLAKEPGERYERASEVRAALEAIGSHASDQPGERADARQPGPAWRALGVATIVIAALVAVWFINPGGWRTQLTAFRSGPGIRSIAVLPLDNYSGDSNQDYFAEGITDELTAALSTISRLRVISRGSAMQFRGAQRPSTPDIARALNVDVVVEGSVMRVGDKVRITAQLIDARADKHLWARTFERSSGDVLALQAELASAIAHEIDVQLTPTEQSRLTTAPRVDPEAHDAYLKGRYFFNRPSDDNLKKAIAQFEQAVQLSPDFAPAYSGLSDAYLWAGYNEGFLTATEARPKAREAAEMAVRLDDHSAEAHTSLAVFKLFYEYDWDGCEREFRKAIALNPSYAYAPDQFSLGLAFQGRIDEAIAEGKRAADLDPLSPQILIDAAVVFMLRGDSETAKHLAKKAAELDPTYYFPAMMEGWADCEVGKAGDAIPALTRAKAMGSPAFATAWLAYAYGASGDRGRAMAELQDLKKRSLRGQVAPFNLALVYLGLGDRPRTLEYLEQAYAADSQWLGWLKNDRIFDPLRSEPRFLALLRKLGFEK